MYEPVLEHTVSARICSQRDSSCARLCYVAAEIYMEAWLMLSWLWAVPRCQRWVEISFPSFTGMCYSTPWYTCRGGNFFTTISPLGRRPLYNQDNRHTRDNINQYSTCSHALRQVLLCVSCTVKPYIVINITTYETLLDTQRKPEGMMLFWYCVEHSGAEIAPCTI